MYSFFSHDRCMNEEVDIIMDQHHIEFIRYTRNVQIKTYFRDKHQNFQSICFLINRKISPIICRNFLSPKVSFLVPSQRNVISLEVK